METEDMTGSMSEAETPPETAAVAENTAEPTPVVGATAGTQFPVPVAMYNKTLKGSPDEVYCHLLATLHGSKKYTMAGWKAVLIALRKQPA